MLRMIYYYFELFACSKYVVYNDSEVYETQDGTTRSCKQIYRAQIIKTSQHRYPQQVAGGKED